MIIFDNRYNNDDDYSDDGDDYGGLGHRNLDPTRHTNSDALKAHIITFEVTNTSLIAHFFRSLAHNKILLLLEMRYFFADPARGRRGPVERFLHISHNLQD